MLRIKFNQAKAIIRREAKNGNKDFEIYVLPCKVRINNIWMSPYKIVANSYDKFQDECSKYMYYNCNSELGEHLNYYITETYKKYLIENYK